MEKLSIYSDLAPLFYLMRVMVLLPFSKFTPTHGLQSAFKNHLVVFCWQMTLLSCYVRFYILSVQDFIKSYNTESQASEIMSSAILLLMQCIDLVNTLIIMAFYLLANSHLNKYMKLLEKADANLPVKSTKINHVICLTIFVTYFTAKMVLSKVLLDADQGLVRLGARAISGIIMASEQTFITLCLQLGKRLKNINSALSKMSSEMKPSEVKRLRNCYDCVSQAHKVLSEKLGPYLLFNLTQLFMLSLCSLLFAFNACNIPRASSASDECRGHLVFFVETSFRFSLLIWSCNSLSVLVGV
jgi:hypothetical protein